MNSLDQTSNYSNEYFNFKTLLDLIFQMVHPNPCERPDCKEILQKLQLISIRQQLIKDSHRIDDQVNVLENFENKFFIEFYQAKIDSEPVLQSHLSNIDPDALIQEGERKIEEQDDMTKTIMGYLDDADHIPSFDWCKSCKLNDRVK